MSQESTLRALTYVLTARSNEYLGRNESAIKDYSESLRIRPNNEWEWALAKLYTKQGKQNKALEHYQIAKKYYEEDGDKKTVDLIEKDIEKLETQTKK